MSLNDATDPNKQVTVIQNVFTNSELTLVPISTGSGDATYASIDSNNVITYAEEQEWAEEIELVQKSQVDKQMHETMLQVLEPMPSNNEMNTKENLRLLSTGYIEKLEELEKRVLDAIEQNKQKQIAIAEFQERKEAKKEIPRHICTFPYFRNLEGLHAPSNEITKLKAERGELNPVQLALSKSWTAADELTLKNAITDNVKANKLSHIYSLIEELKKEKAYDQSKLSELKAERVRVSQLTFENVFQQIDTSQLNWAAISRHPKLAKKFSLSECKKRWIFNLSPNVNREKWKGKETRKLIALVEKYKMQEWDEIAKDLGTGRTAMQCCVKFMQLEKTKLVKFTQEEDTKLLALVEQFRSGNIIPWRKVTWYMGNRTLRQCRERYTYRLNKNIQRGAFSDIEDMIIVTAAKECKMNFRRVAEKLSNRTTPQVRARYEYLVATSMKQFSKEEDKLLVNLVGKYRSNFKAVAAHFEHRTALQCRKRWEKIRRFESVLAVLNKTAEPTNDSDVNVAEEYPLNLAEGVVGNRKKRGRKPVKETTFACYDELVRYLNTAVGRLYRPLSDNENVESIDNVTMAKVAFSSLSVRWDVSQSPQFNAALSSNWLNMNQKKLALDIVNRRGDNLSVVHDLHNISTTLIPPHFQTIQALYALLNTRQEVRYFSQYYDCLQLRKPPNSEVKQRLLFSDAMRLWKMRVRALFTLPWILSFFSLNESAVVRPESKKRTEAPKTSLKLRGQFMNKLKFMRRTNPLVSNAEVIKALIDDDDDDEEEHEKTATGVKRKRSELEKRLLVNLSKEQKL